MEKVEVLKQEWDEAVKGLPNRLLSEVQADIDKGGDGLLAKWELKIRDEIRGLGRCI